jgi:hypothetical protein
MNVFYTDGMIKTLNAKNKKIEIASINTAMDFENCVHNIWFDEMKTSKIDCGKVIRCNCEIDYSDEKDEFEELLRQVALENKKVRFYISINKKDECILKNLVIING